jgi:hypothetical protein
MEMIRPTLSGTVILFPLRSSVGFAEELEDADDADDDDFEESDADDAGFDETGDEDADSDEDASETAFDVPEETADDVPDEDVLLPQPPISDMHNTNARTGVNFFFISCPFPSDAPSVNAAALLPRLLHRRKTKAPHAIRHAAQVSLADQAPS